MDIAQMEIQARCDRDEIRALREENARLRQRVEELERAPRCCADTIPPGCRTCRCADAAEAKLAKVVTLLTNVEWSDNPWNAIKAARAAAQPKEETR